MSGDRTNLNAFLLRWHSKTIFVPEPLHSSLVLARWFALGPSQKRTLGLQLASMQELSRNWDFLLNSKISRFKIWSGLVMSSSPFVWKALSLLTASSPPTSQNFFRVRAKSYFGVYLVLERPLVFWVLFPEGLRRKARRHVWQSKIYMLSWYHRHLRKIDRTLACTACPSCRK